MPGHSKDGYASVTWSYNFQYRESARVKPGREGFQERVDESLKTMQPKHVDLPSTRWAECAKNQTGDKFISQWVSTVVKPAAIEEVKRYIRDRNAENKDKRARFFASDNKLLGQGQSPPPLVTYLDFDIANLSVKKPHRQDKQPDGLVIRWVCREIRFY